MKEYTLFDLLNCITYDKPNWDDIPVELRNMYNQYIINRYITMINNQSLLFINEMIQPFKLPDNVHYTLLKDVLPKKKQFIKYITTKQKNNKTDNVIPFLIENLQIGMADVELLLNKVGEVDIFDYLISHGYNKKQIKEKFGINGKK